MRTSSCGLRPSCSSIPQSSTSSSRGLTVPPSTDARQTIFSTKSNKEDGRMGNPDNCPLFYRGDPSHRSWPYNRPGFDCRCTPPTARTTPNEIDEYLSDQPTPAALELFAIALPVRVTQVPGQPGRCTWKVFQRTKGMLKAVSSAGQFLLPRIIENHQTTQRRTESHNE